MTVFDPVDAVRRYHQAIAALDFEAVARCLAEDAVYRSAGTGEAVGKAAILRAFDAYFTRWADQKAEDELVEEVAASTVRSVWRLQAVDAATGTLAERRGEEFVFFDRNGLIRAVEVRDDPRTP